MLFSYILRRFRDATVHTNQKQAAATTADITRNHHGIVTVVCYEDTSDGLQDCRLFLGKYIPTSSYQPVLAGHTDVCE
jgi:hypothetical protein